MFEINYKGLTYSRLLSNSINETVTEGLKANYDYSYIVSYDRVFEDKSYSIIDKNSCLFDMNMSTEEIVKGFNSTGRNEFRRTYRTPGLDFQLNTHDFEKYYYFYSRCEHARNWFPVPAAELKSSLLFTAIYNGEYISGMSCFTGEGVVRVSRIYSTKRINTNPLISGTIYGGAARRLVIEICEYARRNNFKYVDLGGVDLSGNEKSGISEFKLSLGGEIFPVKIGRFMKPEFVQKQKEILAEGFDIT